MSVISMIMQVQLSTVIVTILQHLVANTLISLILTTSPYFYNQESRK